MTWYELLWHTTSTTRKNKYSQARNMKLTIKSGKEVILKVILELFARFLINRCLAFGKLLLRSFNFLPNLLKQTIFGLLMCEHCISITICGLTKLRVFCFNKNVGHNKQSIRTQKQRRKKPRVLIFFFALSFKSLKISWEI